MADTTPATGLVVQQWDDQFFMEYIQASRFKSAMGTDENAVIQMKEDLTKKKGDTITIAMINRLTNAATTGTDVMEGHEEDMTSRSHPITVNKRRNAVRVAEMSEQRSAIDLRSGAKATLKDWSIEDTRDLIITALGSLNGTAFLSRTAAIGDAWLVDNADRVLFGAASAGYTDLSADLLLLDTTADKFDVTALDAMILKAKTCAPKIKPIRDDGNGKRYYLVYCNPFAFKNLKDSMTNASGNNSLAVTVIEQENSKLFEGGDLHWNGAIVKEVDELPVYPNIGSGGTTEVTPVYLCGAQALGYALAKRWNSRTKEFDYGDKVGVEINSIYGINKLLFGTGTGDRDDLKDHGVVTGYFATTASPTPSITSAAEVG